KAGALLVSADVLFLSRRDRLVALAAQHKIPAIYFQREFVLAGGLMSYDSTLADAYHQADIYVVRVPKAAKPSDCPAAQPTKLAVTINLTIAKALGLTVPMIRQMTADEVIE